MSLNLVCGSCLVTASILPATCWWLCFGFTTVTLTAENSCFVATMADQADPVPEEGDQPEEPSGEQEITGGILHFCRKLFHGLRTISLRHHGILMSSSSLA